MVGRRGTRAPGLRGAILASGLVGRQATAGDLPGAGTAPLTTQASHGRRRCIGLRAGPRRAANLSGMPEPTVLCSHQDGVLTLTLNRPAKLNAIDNDLAAALLDGLRSAADAPAVRVIRLRGQGRAFCAGRDVGAPPTEQDLVRVQAVASAIVRHPKPVVAAVHGWTVGAGFEWAMCADVVLAAGDARFKLPEASLGLFVTGGLMATLPAAAGLARAKALMLLGEEFGAREAVEWGLMHRAVPAEQLDAVSLDVCLRLAALQAHVLTRYKRVLNDIGLERFQRAIDAESRATRELTGDTPAADAGP